MATIIATSTPKLKSWPVDLWLTQWSISRSRISCRARRGIRRQQRFPVAARYRDCSLANFEKTIVDLLARGKVAETDKILVAANAVASAAKPRAWKKPPTA
jgi:hypothetical protein